MGATTRKTQLYYTETVTEGAGGSAPGSPADEGEFFAGKMGLGDIGPAPAGEIGFDAERIFPDKPVSELSSKELGDIGEKLATLYLYECGFDIIERGYRCSEGEADIVAYDPTGDMVVLVEVKTRRSDSISDGTFPEEAVTKKKQRRYRRIAACFAMDHYPTPAIRFDVIGVTIDPDGDSGFEHFEGAFDWDGGR